MLRADLASLFTEGDPEGNRSGQAIVNMKANGFTGELRNAGALANAAAQTGLAIVK